MIASENLRKDLFEQTIIMIDVLFRLNSRRPAEDRIEENLFTNETVNNALDLDTLFDSWAIQMHVKVRNNM